MINLNPQSLAFSSSKWLKSPQLAMGCPKLSFGLPGKSSHNIQSGKKVA